MDYMACIVLCIYIRACSLVKLIRLSNLRQIFIWSYNLMDIKIVNTSQKSIFKDMCSSVVFSNLLYIFFLSMVRPQIRQWVIKTPANSSAVIQYHLFYLQPNRQYTILYSFKKSLPEKSKKNMPSNSWQLLYFVLRTFMFFSWLKPIIPDY